MPSRNTLRVDVDNTYYHVYARGASRQPIFFDDKDYAVFLNLLKRYLGNEPVRDGLGREYANFYDTVELVSYCLMPNHYHLLLYQHEAGNISRMMRGVMTSYSHYFNTKYNRSGSLFESRFKAAIITSDNHLLHISRYIHLNPKEWQSWPWSSLPYYQGKAHADWVRPQRALVLFNNDNNLYMKFVRDYEDYKNSLKTIKHELAGE